MDTGNLAIICIFAVPIIGGLCFKMFDRWIKFEERKWQVMGNTNSTKTNDNDIEELRQQISSVSETATQYDLSIQHTLDQILRRLEYIESQRANVPYVPTTPANTDLQEQTLGVSK